MEPAGRSRVLLVEDDPDVRDVLQQTLAEAGHTVETAATCAEGARLLLSHPVDLLVTDLVLGDGDGAALMRMAERRNIPVVGITGHPTRPRLAPASPRLAPRVLLQKPFRGERLTQVAHRLLAHERAG